MSSYDDKHNEDVLHNHLIIWDFDCERGKPKADYLRQTNIIMAIKP